MTPEIPTQRPEGLDTRTKVIVLKLKDGDKTYRLNKARIIIGSIVSADVRVQGEGVAPIHAVLEIGDENVGIIYDLASDSGVYVNGKKIVTQVVGQGENFTIGRYTFVFELRDLQTVQGEVQKGERKEFTKLLDGSTLFFDPKEDFKPLILEDERYVEEVFDYRPSANKALEIIMAWAPMRGELNSEPLILDVEHFMKEKSVVLGQKQSDDFGIPPLLGDKRYPLVTRSGETYTLNLSNEMNGVVSRKGEIFSFADWRKGSGGNQIPLDSDDFAKVSIGDLDFYLSFTAAPPKLKRRGLEKDFLFYKVMATSLLLTGLIIGGVSRVHVTETIEAEQIPERLATILYNPQNFTPPKPTPPPAPPVKETPKEDPKPVAEVKPKPPEPKPTQNVKVELTPKKVEPKPIPEKIKVTPEKKPDAKVAQNQQSKGASQRPENEAKEGEGARAKGQEGARGQKNAKSGKTHQDAAFRPSPQAGEGRGAGNSQVVDEGNIDILKGAGAKIQDLLGNSGENLGKGGEKLKGFGGFTTKGEGGLALQGSGKGGGGTAETTLGGLGNKGTGGGRVGTGKGAAGNGSGIVGGATRVALRTGGAEELVTMGSIDQDAILAALLAHKDEFRLCYEREINAETPSATGTVKPSWTIGSSGRVTQASIDSTTLNNPSVERCVLTVIRRIQFPTPEGATVTVTFPFKFSPVGG